MELLSAGALPGRPSRALMPVADWGPTSAVYADCYRTMLRLAFTLTGSRETAEDAVHDAFCTAGPKLGDVDDPVPYLHIAVVNRCRSLHRSSAAEHRRIERVTSGRRDDEPTDALAAAHASHADLTAALDRLPFNQRAVVVLRYLADLPDERIAEILDCRRATVRSHLRRGLAALRKDLS